ncbi:MULTISPECIES: hypothetical protein [unclassified Micromonospora]|uniref:hypothetical protein n=1 Tax=unclassified Micromonospora TaxID=2617518 RepID=UPI003316CD36
MSTYPFQPALPRQSVTPAGRLVVGLAGPARHGGNLVVVLLLAGLVAFGRLGPWPM